MPKINTYPTITPSTSDLLLISDTSATDNPTKTCTVNDIVALGSGGIQPIESVTVSLTTAQITTLRTVPIIIVPAPGAGKIVVPISMMVEFTYGTAAITGNTDINLTQDTALADGNIGMDVLGLGVDGIVFSSSAVSGAPDITNYKLVANTATYLKSLAGAPTMGASTATMKVTVFYVSHTL